MATVTPNFIWPVPTSTDLVKDGATAIEALGDSIDGSLVDLKGGTTGQVLSKNSNTDMDFVWVTDAAGDITGVTAGTGISGGGTSGTVTVTNSMATAIDAKGDLIGGTGDDTFARLAVGTNGQVLTADSTTATGLKWATASGGGKILQVVYGQYATSTTVASTTYTDTGLSASITPTSSSSKILVLVTQQAFILRTANIMGFGLKLLRGSTAIYEPSNVDRYGQGWIRANGATEVALTSMCTFAYQDSPSTTSSTTYKVQGAAYLATSGGYVNFQENSSSSNIVLMEIGA